MTTETKAAGQEITLPRGAASDLIVRFVMHGVWDEGWGDVTTLRLMGVRNGSDDVLSTAKDEVNKEEQILRIGQRIIVPTLLVDTAPLSTYTDKPDKIRGHHRVWLVSEEEAASVLVQARLAGHGVLDFVKLQKERRAAILETFAITPAELRFASCFNAQHKFPEDHRYSQAVLYDHVEKPALTLKQVLSGELIS